VTVPVDATHGAPIISYKRLLHCHYLRLVDMIRVDLARVYFFRRGSKEGGGEPRQLITSPIKLV